MAKTKISEYSSTANSNTDIASINIDEGCAPSGINNAIRALMAQLKNFQTGADGDSFNGPVGTTTPAAGAFTTLSASSTLSVTGAGTIQGLTVGKGAGAVSTNTAVGVSALGGASQTGDNICAFGFSTLGSNTTGYSNNAFGREALGANTTGNSNTALGWRSLYSNTTASNNTAVGYQAGYANTTGAITAVGYFAGKSNTTATNNTAIGTVASYLTTTGADNTSLGYAALYLNSTGGSNTAIGSQALLNTTASNNTAVGYQAGYTNATGTQNVFIGNQAGYTSNVSGSARNTIIGNQAGFNLTTATANTFIGAGPNGGAGETITTGSKNSILGAYNGNQGGLDIRTASNYIVLSDGDGNPSGFCDASNGWHFGLGTSAYSGTMTLHGYTTSGYGPCLIGSTGAYSSQTSRWYAGSNSYIKGGTSYDTYTVAAGAAASGGVNLTSGATSWASASDSRLKNVTGTFTNALADISQIEAVKFTWKDDKEAKPQVGVIAQSVQGVVPEAIDLIRVSKDDETDYLSVKYTELIPLMIASIQELNAKVEAQAAEIVALKGQA